MPLSKFGRKPTARLPISNSSRMPRHKLVICLLLLLALATGFQIPFAGVSAAAPAIRSGEVLVKFRGSANPVKILIDPAQNITEVVARYQQFSGVEYVEPNATFQATAFPNDPQYIRQGYLVTINAREAWSKELLVRESESITHRSTIAFLDTGVDMDHPDLQTQIWTNPNEKVGDGIDNDSNGFIDDIHGWDFVDGDNDPNPRVDSGVSEQAAKHGTIISGVAAAAGHNLEGIAGVSWNSQIVPLRVLDSTGVGDAYNVVRAIDYAIAKKVDVINMSFVGPTYSQSLFNAIQRAYNSGIVVVAAAGNTDPNSSGQNLSVVKNYPVCYDQPDGKNIVIGVASVGANLQKSIFSNYGGCIDIVAPGEGFYSTEVYQPAFAGFQNSYGGLWSGTSVSAPLVSAAAGMIRSVRPSLSVDQVRDAILSTASSVDSFNPRTSKNSRPNGKRIQYS